MITMPTCSVQTPHNAYGALSDSPATLWMFRLTPFTSLHICEKQFEPVTQRPHIWILMLLQFERLWDNFHGPALQLGIQTRFEAKVEVSRMLWIDAKSVIASFGVGFSVGCQPALWKKWSALNLL